MASSSDPNLESLEARVARLSQDKARMGLVFSAYERFAEVEGIDQIVAFILEISLNLHGGDNVILYYRVNERWYYRDILGRAGVFKLVADTPLARAIESQHKVDELRDVSDVAPFLQRGHEQPQQVCSTWYPMLHRGEVIAVLELTDRLVWDTHADDELMTFYRYAAATLHSSIQNQEALERKNRDLARANEELQVNLERLEQANAEKETLLREVHHRVKNNLQVMASLVSLQAQGLTDDAVNAPLRDIEARIKSMSVIHELLYKNNDFTRIDLAAYLESLLMFLSSTYDIEARSVTWDLKAEGIDLPLSQCVPCGLILNEVVSNALKHAFPNGRRGTISVRISRVGQECRVEVQDDGVGIPGDVSFEEGDGLGFQLVPALASQLHGTAQISGGDGTAVTVQFPLEQPS